jgi:uncharacterized protein (DUF1499 family)
MISSLILCLILVSVDGFTMSGNSYKRSYSCRALSMSSADDAPPVKESLLSKVKPALAFYALMLAPIYGIGLPFLGSMTDFTVLQNRGSPGVIANEFIVAPSSFTPARTSYPPYFDVSAEVLESAFDKVALRQPRITAIAADKSTLRREYVQRALIFRWPDVITFQAIPLDDGKSTLAIHSYSIYGAGDLGVNEARVKSWISMVEVELAKK